MSTASLTPSEDSPRRPPDARRFVERARLLCRRECAFEPGRDALVMVSGGQDSLALLHLLATGALGGDGPRSVRALHVNHHLRGAESESDEALVRGHCASLGVELEVASVRIDKGTGNTQERAREGRREAALAASRRMGVERIALGHTLDDQVETMLYRLGRYAGLGALAPMSPVALPWVRPLLTSRRSETASYCASQGLTFAVDRGNEYPGYARTGIRGRMIPVWEEILPGAVEAAGRTAEVTAEAMEIVRRAVAEAERSVSLGPLPADQGGAGAGRVPRAVSAARLAGLPRALRRAVLRSLLVECLGREVERSLVLEVEALVEGGGSAERAVGDGWIAVREYDVLRLEPGVVRRSGQRGDGEPSAQEDRLPLPCPGEVVLGGLLVRAEPSERYRAHDPSVEAYLDADALGAGLWVRRPRPGDRMKPLGSGGRRSLQDILVDLKIPRGARAGVPVVGCGECIVWLAGLAVAEEGRITGATTRMVHLSVAPVGNQDRGGLPGYGA